jgi:hypothetical protein
MFSGHCSLGSFIQFKGWRYAMKVRRLAILGAAGLGATALLARNGECSISMHPEDWLGLEEGDTHRRYRSPRHAFHHIRELALMLGQVSVLYLLRPIPPAFREQIMLVTAVCDDCPG